MVVEVNGGYYGGIGIGIYGPGLGYYGSPYYYPPYYAYPPAVVTVPATPPVYIQQGTTRNWRPSPKPIIGTIAGIQRATT